MAIGKLIVKQNCWTLGFLVVLSILMALSYGCTQSPNPTANAPISNTATTARSGVLAINVQDAYSLIKNKGDNSNFVILDVRTAGEFSGGHLAGAVNMDYYSPDFKSNVGKLDRTKEYLVYCQTGIRSTAATQIMADLDFANVDNLTGGFSQWLSAGYPVTK
jgi:rhodanese-related sulfurtransferase